MKKAKKNLNKKDSEIEERIYKEIEKIVGVDKKGGFKIVASLLIIVIYVVSLYFLFTGIKRDKLVRENYSEYMDKVLDVCTFNNKFYIVGYVSKDELDSSFRIEVRDKNWNLLKYYEKDESSGWEGFYGCNFFDGKLFVVGEETLLGKEAGVIYVFDEDLNELKKVIVPTSRYGGENWSDIYFHSICKEGNMYYVVGSCNNQPYIAYFNESLNLTRDFIINLGDERVSALLSCLVLNGTVYAVGTSEAIDVASSNGILVVEDEKLYHVKYLSGELTEVVVLNKTVYLFGEESYKMDKDLEEESLPIYDVTATYFYNGSIYLASYDDFKDSIKILEFKDGKVKTIREKEEMEYYMPTGIIVDDENIYVVGNHFVKEGEDSSLLSLLLGSDIEWFFLTMPRKKNEINYLYILILTIVVIGVILKLLS